MKKRLYGLKQDKVVLGRTRDKYGDVIYNINQAEFEPSKYYIEDGHIHRYTKEELAVLDNE